MTLETIWQCKRCYTLNLASRGICVRCFEKRGVYEIERSELRKKVGSPEREDRRDLS